MHRAQFLSPLRVASPIAGLPNWSWHEYGMRRGVWRFFFQAFRAFCIRPTLSINARGLARIYERVAAKRDAVGNAWLILANAYRCKALEDQSAMIERTLRSMQKFTNRRPSGG